MFSASNNKNANADGVGNSNRNANAFGVGNDRLGEHRPDGSLGDPNEIEISESRRKAKVQDCLQLIKALPKCNSVEGMVRDQGFPLEVARYLNSTFMDVERKDVKVGQLIFVPGLMPPRGTTILQIMSGLNDSVGVQVQEIKLDGTIVGVCWGAGGTRIDPCWRQDDQVVFPPDITFFLVPKIHQGMFTCPIGKPILYSTPESDKRAKERDERDDERESKRKRRSARYSSSESDEEEERKMLNGFYIRCADNVKRVVMTKTGADAKILEIQGLLRVWTTEVSDVYLRDLVLDFPMIRRAANSKHPGAFMADDYLEAELGMFEKLSAINDLPCVKSDTILRKTVMGYWDLTKPDRLTLSNFLVSKQEGGWSVTSEALSKVLIFEAAKNLQLTIGAVWGKAFHAALDPIFELQYEKKQLVHYYPAAYIAAQLERALHRFNIIVFAERSTGKYTTQRRTPQGCAELLRTLVMDAVDYKAWEPFRCDMFFAPGGYYELHCKKTPKTPEGGDKSTKDARSSGQSSQVAAKRQKKAGSTGKTPSTTEKPAITTTREPKTVICVNRLAELFGPKGTAACSNNPCPFIHYRKTIFETPKADVLTLLRSQRTLKNAEAIIKRVEADKTFSA